MTLWTCPACTKTEFMSDPSGGGYHQHEEHGRWFIYPLRLVSRAPLRLTAPTQKPAVPVDYAGFSAPLPPQKEAPRLRRKKRRAR